MAVEDFRGKLGERLGADDLEAVRGPDGISTALRPGLLRAWRQFSKDPDDQVEEWLYHGGPCGILRMPADCGIFPTNPDDPGEIQDPSTLLTGTELDFTTVREDDGKAYEEMERFVAKGYVMKFASLEEARSFAGGTIAPSRLMLLEKVKSDGKVKLRVILNCKQSGVSAVSHNAERVILPRTLDVVFDAVELMAEHEGHEEHEDEFAVIGFTEAFWQIPVCPCERRFFVVILRGSYYVIDRATQGSRGGPLFWGRTAAMITRFAQVVCDPAVLRLNTYVDDPIMALHGSVPQRDTALCKVLLVWLAPGFALDRVEGPTGTFGGLDKRQAHGREEPGPCTLR